MFKKIFRFGIKTVGFVNKWMPKPLVMSLLSEILVTGIKALDKYASKGEKSDKALEKIRDIVLYGVTTWVKNDNTITDNEFLKETKRKLDIKRCPRDFDGY